MQEGTGATFKDMEHAGWEAKAGTYGAFAGKVTAQAVEHLLSAVDVRPGMRLLDVASGPGWGAAAAAARGAEAVGVDFASAMVAEASRAYPAVEFREGDAENLPFADASFDAVICGFGLLHMAEPDKAIAEARRVLRPGGRYAFTVWSTPERHEFYTIVLGAIQAHGNMDVPLPPAPPMFRFSDVAECEKALAENGFVEPSVEEIALRWRGGSPQEIVDLLDKSTVRTAVLLEHQTPEALAAIHAAIRERVESRRKEGAYELAWPAVLAAARKP